MTDYRRLICNRIAVLPSHNPDMTSMTATKSSSPSTLRSPPGTLSTHGSPPGPSCTRGSPPEASSTASCKRTRTRTKPKEVFEVIMPTARVKYHGQGGSWVETTEVGCALLDSGATQSFISQDAVTRANIVVRERPVSMTVVGVTGEVEATHEAVVSMVSPATNYILKVTLVVLPSLGSLKEVTAGEEILGQPDYFRLSDYFPSPPRSIDFILGSDILWDIYLSEEVLKFYHYQIMVHPTKLGDVMSGVYLGDNNGIDKAPERIADRLETCGHVAHGAAQPQWHQLHPMKKTGQTNTAVVMAALEGSKALQDHVSELIGQQGKQASAVSLTAQVVTAADCNDVTEADGVELADHHKKSASSSRPVTKKERNSIEERLDRFMTYEGLGIMPVDAKNANMKPLDIVALESWKKSLSFKDGAYSVGLTFNPDHEELSNNRDSAVAQFLALERRFKKDPVLYSKYKKEIEVYKENDVEPCKGKGKVGEIRYLPHSAVVTESKTRIVFNGSSRSGRGPSLNDCLLTGPQSGSQDLFKILLGFRDKKVAVGGDVRRMYLCIYINDSDRDFLRFIWRNEETGELEEYRFIKVPFGIKDAPFLAQETFIEHAKKYLAEFPEIVKVLIFQRWVDDIITSVDTEEEAIAMIKIIVRIMSEGGFQLRKWISNSEAVMASVPLEDRLDKDKPINFQEDSEDSFKALGVQWFVASDTLRFTNMKKDLEVGTVVTKRLMSSVISAFFDPLSTGAPFSVIGKRLLQRVWITERRAMEAAKAAGASSRDLDKKRKQSWDKPVSQDIADAFNEWREQLADLDGFAIQRCLIDDKEVKNKQLHFFSDASIWIFATAVYLRTEYMDGTVSSRLVCSRNRVAGEDDTLPRLELMGALLSSRVAVAVREVLDPEKSMECFFWVDSSTAYQWIIGDYNHWKVYVSNRVKEIQAHTRKDQWKHIPGTDNPADLATRGLTALEFVGNKLWLEGPKWLVQDQDQWPHRTFTYRSLEDDDMEAKPTHLALVATRSQTRSKKVEKLADWNILRTIRERCGTLEKILRVTILFMDKEKRGGLPDPNQEARRRALQLHVKDVQGEAYKSELACLQNDMDIPVKSSLAGVGVFLDLEGVLRSQGRYMPTSDCATPMILPYKSDLFKLLVLQTHMDHAHPGPEWTFFHLRKEFWAARARRTIKEILLRCIRCKKMRARVAQQQMAPLPTFRHQENPRPYTHVGVDYAGPIPCYDEDGKQVKTWISIFTCFQIRHVHLELVTSCSAEDFLLAMRRFIALYGCSSFWYSDNSKTFKRSAKEVAALSKLIENKDIQNAIKSKGITWKFITEHAPWHGALYERLIRSVKDSLKGAIGNEKLSIVQFQTALLEAAAIVNSRPLAEVTDDASDPLPVSPSMLLHGYDLENRPYPVALKVTNDKGLALLWKRRLQLQHQLMTRFAMNYITDLRERQKWKKKYPNLKVGQLVLVDTPGKKRLQWPLGRIVEILPGRDNLTRSVRVKANDGTFRRPIQRLVPLEVVGETDDNEDEDQQEAEDQGGAQSEVPGADPKK